LFAWRWLRASAILKHQQELSTKKEAEKRGRALLTEPTGCGVEIGMKHQIKKTGVMNQE
jgi:hypothetical protein